MQFHHWQQLQTLVAAHQDRLTNLLLSPLVLCHLQAVKSQLLPQLEENKIIENGHFFKKIINVKNITVRKFTFICIHIVLIHLTQGFRPFHAKNILKIEQNFLVLNIHNVRY